MDGGQYIEEMSFAGGMEFKLKTGGTVRSSNLTPDEQTGIGAWTKEMFIKKFKAFNDSTYVPYQVHAGDFNTEMPWEYYAKLSEEDLGAIYEYLRSIPPVNHLVVKFTAP